MPADPPVSIHALTTTIGRCSRSRWIHVAEHSCCALPRDPPPVLCRACPAAMSSPLQYSTSVEDNEDALSVGTTPPVDAGAPAYVLPSGHPRFGFMSAPVVTTTPPPFPAGALRRSQSFASTRGLRTSPMSPPRSTIRVHCGVWTACAVLDSVATGPPCLVR